MTRQINENRAVSQGRGNTPPTHGDESPGGEKSVPVNQRMKQLEMDLGSAEYRCQERPDGARARNAYKAQALAGTLPKDNPKAISSATMEVVVSLLRVAFDNVAANKGAPGPDDQTIEQMRRHLTKVLERLSLDLLEGTYRPGDIRRVWIPKAGGQRPLGIPNVVDRTVAEAIRLALEPLYEPKFSSHSHGFRPGRSCHTAIQAATQYVEEGFDWVVDIDLENFFNCVHHQRLLARLSQTVSDPRLLKVIHLMLKALVVMPNDVAVKTEEGVPQGGPLSPLLSNIVLDELDQELERRGHRYCRYADDLNVYVKSKRAGERVMTSLTKFIEKRLRLKVNVKKSAVDRPSKRHFVGFSLERNRSGEVRIVLSKRSLERLGKRIVELTPRNWGSAFKRCIAQINTYLKGWFGFFGIACFPAGSLDAHIRRRLRAILLKQWKRNRSRAHKLIQLGVSRRKAWRSVYKGRQSIWALSHNSAVERGLRNAYFAERGLVSLQDLSLARCQRMVALAHPAQMSLALE